VGERLEITLVDPTLMVEVQADVTRTVGHHQGNSSDASAREETRAVARSAGRDYALLV
jgi:hypothetical protein